MRHPFSRPRDRRALAALAALSAAACSAVLGVGPASAAASGPDDLTSVVVTRLSITGGRGWLVLQPRIGLRPSVGFEVFVRAGGPLGQTPCPGCTWGGPPVVHVPEMGIDCRRVPGSYTWDGGPWPDLHYVCGARNEEDEDPVWPCCGMTGRSVHRDGDPPPAELPSGGYQISIPVTRTGPVDGLTGYAWMNAVDETYPTVRSYSPDTFPVLDGSHYRSTAEVRAAVLVPDPDGSADRTKLSLTTTIVPGESITAVDVSLPDYGWRIIGSNAATHQVRCGVVPGPDSPVLHCQPAAADGSLPAGRYPLALTLGTTRRPAPPCYAEPTSPTCWASRVSLTAAGVSPQVQDTFRWDDPHRYG
jgi:hypothetical protein